MIFGKFLHGISRFMRRLLRGKWRASGFLTSEDEAYDLICERSAADGFKMWKDPVFRELAGYDGKDDGEQDRIFNEVLVTTIIYAKAFLEDNLPYIREDRREFWRAVEKSIPTQFYVFLGRIGIPSEQVMMWEKVYEQRRCEYLSDAAETRHAWAKELIESNNDILDYAGVRLGTISISAMLHIRRSKPEGDKDPLINYFRARLAMLENKLFAATGW